MAAPPYRVMKKPIYRKVTEREYCPKLFEDAWGAIDAEFEEPIRKLGHEFGVGTKMKIRVDNGNIAEGVFLGRLVEMEQYKTTKYMFYDYNGSKIYLLDEAKTNIRFEGKDVGNEKIQPLIESKEQYGENCAAYALVTFLKQMHVNGFKGTGKLAERLKTKAGVGDLMVMAVDNYYVQTRGADFQGFFKKLSDDLGIKCRELKYVSPAAWVEAIKKSVTLGSPVLIEFNIGPNMITTDHQWVDIAEKYGEDRRIWGPRATGERNSGGHAVVATEFFESPSGRLKMLLADSDWNRRPVMWDVENYLLERKKSGGIQAHVCFDK